MHLTVDSNKHHVLLMMLVKHSHTGAQDAVLLQFNHSKYYEFFFIMTLYLNLNAGYCTWRMTMEEGSTSHLYLSTALGHHSLSTPPQSC
mmetsp:Transcript_1273/g.1778  ORF Transcript_1273/g.1778 Transcript_1273/m.1778 type:complete len:89 (-) Transcript_1273:950-1216(-)